MRFRRVPLLLVAGLAVVVTGQAAALTVRLGDGDRARWEAIGAGPGPVVSDILLTEGRVQRAALPGDRHSPPVHSLYGDAGLDDPLAGPTLAVGTAIDDAYELVPTAENPGFRPIDLDGRRAAVGQDRAWTWVTWRLGCFEECFGYVAGRNLAEADVVAAARLAQGVTVERPAPTLPADALPAGMGLLATGGLNLRGFGMDDAQEVTWEPAGGGGNGSATLTVVDDVRLALLLRFWIDGVPTSVRGQAGSSGATAAVGVGVEDPFDARAWSEDGRGLIVLGRDLPKGAIDRFVDGLRAARPGEWDDVRGRVLDVSTDGAVEDCHSPTNPRAAVGGRGGSYRWAVGFAVGRFDHFDFCFVVVTPERRLGGGVSQPLPASGRLAVATYGLGGSAEPVGLFVAGVAPPGTARVTVEVAGDPTVDADLAEQGPAAGERYFATFVEGDPRADPTVTAFDGSGAVLDRRTIVA